MTYFDISYVFLFLPVVIIIYNIMPKKIRPLILLIASFIFFFMISSKLIIFLILSIISIYLSGIIMEKINNKRDLILENANKEDKKGIKIKYKKIKKNVLIISIIFNVSFLFFFKYLNFFEINLNYILDYLNIEYRFSVIKYIAPIGISFYTLQALSYLVDVYNDKIKADKNILRLSLFMSFFPQIMEGPIARYNDTAKKLYEGIKVNYHNFCFGYQRIIYGLFKKFIIADRLNIMVSLVFKDYINYSGTIIAMGVIGYTIMLYMEFSGTMDVVIGTGEVFNVKIPENFRQPFFSKNISEFWTRWHISLGLWFKDYIFYPVSLSKPMKRMMIKTRKILGNHIGPLISGAIALFAVWSLNGLWHGAGWTFLFYGLYQFTLILSGNLFEPVIKTICSKLHINRKNIIYRIFQSIKMTIFVFIGELFFRAPTLSIGFGMLKKIFTDFKVNTLYNGDLFNLGLDKMDFLVILISLIFIFIISLLKERGLNIRDRIAKKNIYMRWFLYLALVLFIIIFGASGTGYIPVDPIYADF